MVNRQKGNVFIQSDNATFACAEIEPEREGCYYNAKRKLNSINELIVTVVPFIHPDQLDRKLSSRFFRRRIPFAYIRKNESNTYHAWTIQRDRYKKLVYGKKLLNKVKPEKEIHLSGTEVFVKDVNIRLSQK